MNDLRSDSTRRRIQRNEELGRRRPPGRRSGGTEWEADCQDDRRGRKLSEKVRSPRSRVRWRLMGVLSTSCHHARYLSQYYSRLLGYCLCCLAHCDLKGQRNRNRTRQIYRPRRGATTSRGPTRKKGYTVMLVCPISHKPLPSSNPVHESLARWQCAASRLVAKGASSWHGHLMSSLGPRQDIFSPPPYSD